MVCPKFKALLGQGLVSLKMSNFDIKFVLLPSQTYTYQENSTGLLEENSHAITLLYYR